MTKGATDKENASKEIKLIFFLIMVIFWNGKDIKKSGPKQMLKSLPLFFNRNH